MYEVISIPVDGLPLRLPPDLMPTLTSKWHTNNTRSRREYNNYDADFNIASNSYLSQTWKIHKANSQKQIQRVYINLTVISTTPVSVSLCEAEGPSSSLCLELLCNLGCRLKLELVTCISSSKLNSHTEG